MLRKLYLEGDMGEKYGRIAEVKATTVREVIQYLDANYNGVKKYLLDKIFVGHSVSEEISVKLQRKLYPTKILANENIIRRKSSKVFTIILFY